MKRYLHIVFLTVLTVYSFFITKNLYFLIATVLCMTGLYIRRFETSLFSVLFLVFYIIFPEELNIFYALGMSFLILAYMEFYNFYMEDFYPKEVLPVFSICIATPLVLYLFSAYLPEIPASYLLFFLIVAIFSFFYLLFAEK